MRELSLVKEGKLSLLKYLKHPLTALALLHKPILNKVTPFGKMDWH